MTKDEIARSAASQWCRCFKCDGIVNETGLKCVKPYQTCLKWYDGYKTALIAFETQARDAEKGKIFLSTPSTSEDQ